MSEADLRTVFLALLTIVGTVVAALVWTLKALWARAEAMQRQRDAQLVALIAQNVAAIAELKRAVDMFGRFELEEKEVHERGDKMTRSHTDLLTQVSGELARITEVLGSVHRKLDLLLEANGLPTNGGTK